MRTTGKLAALAAVAAMSIGAGAAQARNGADDPAGHHQGRGADDVQPHHHHHHHHHRGHDDGPNHR
jgi:hypothetical protein